MTYLAPALNRLQRSPLLITCLGLLLLASSSVTATRPFPHRRSLLQQDEEPCAATIIHTMYAFGDSTTDTGNAVRTGNPAFQIATQAPYGNTFWGHPTGRFSDGKLMVDDLCDALGVALLPPHLLLQQQEDPRDGGSGSENFAAAGATALEPAELLQIANATSFTTYSLHAEMEWFQHDVAANPLTQGSMIYFGEIGGNDYNYAFASGTPPAVVATLIPHVMDKINSSLEAIVDAGAQKIVVQGEFPMGCMAVYLKTMSGAALDQHGCVAVVSSVSNQHNAMLEEVLEDARARHTAVEFVYLDTTAAFLHVLDHASDYGFSNVTDACFDLTPLLLHPPTATAPPNNTTVDPPPIATPCSDPRTYISWDGIHLTDAMYHTLVDLFLHHGFSSPFPSFITTTSAATCMPHN